MNEIRELEEVNIVLYIVLSIFTFGLFYLYWQYKQFKICNTLLQDDKHSFILWIILSFITLGIYHFYHEYKLSQDIIELQEKYGLKVHKGEYPILCLILSIFGLVLISDFIHQDDLNKIIAATKGQHPIA